MTLLEKALIDLSKILFEKRIRYMVIGGMANAIWGNPRATIDVDVTVSAASDHKRSLSAGPKQHISGGGPEPFILLSLDRCAHSVWSRDSGFYGKNKILWKNFQLAAKPNTNRTKSHRFSTVRMADRILVLENGSHQELMKLAGTYVKMFEKQAQYYR